jgi:hypothetical protein
LKEAAKAVMSNIEGQTKGSALVMSLPHIIQKHRIANEAPGDSTLSQEQI